MEKVVSLKLNNTDIDKFVRLVRLESKLVVLLAEYKESQELQLKRLKRISDAARTLSDWKPLYKEWYATLDEDIKKVIIRAGIGR